MEVFKVADARTRDEKLRWNYDLVKLPYFYSNLTSLFLTEFNIKLQSYEFLNILPLRSVKFVYLDAKITLTFFWVK